jgi:hypothetical protein
VRVFRQAFQQSSTTIPQSPDRQVFGIHPTTNKILVPIDLCVLIDSNPTPDFNLDVGQAKNILNSDTSAPVGKIVNFILQVGNINPIVTLEPDPSDPSDPSSNDGIEKIIVPSNVKAGDVVTLRDTLVKGTILPPLPGNTSLINTFPFPLDMAINVSAFRVKFNGMLQLKDIGSPIIMVDGSTLGMLLTDGQEVFVYPSSLM